ncbi:amidohydrolase [bacterium]|nr:amidohydrolase [bacterium]
MKAFIDCHCHAFNFVDIPMYLTLADKIKMGTVGRLKIAAGALIYLPKLIGDKNFLENKLNGHKEFVLFFERSLDRNIQILLQEIRELLIENPNMPDNTEILITPLVMDFDVLLKEEMPEQVGKEPSVREQYKRLTQAIASTVIQDIPNAKICPFVGFDLRKLLVASKDKLEGFKSFWNSSNTLGKRRVSDLESGKLLGIKLYPPIGFNPYPKSQPDRFKEFYAWCCEQDIPLTVHCQMGSYSAGKEKENLDKNTTPRNWERLFKNHDFKNLRINFAHFGGETGTDDMFEPFRTDKDSWTYILIKLLKKYPNTYADIAAYDYAKREHRNNLVKIFEKDEMNKFGDGYKLADKVLWGSDVPMVISGKSYREDCKSKGESKYKHYFNGFIKSIYSSKKLTSPQKSNIITNLTENNPKRFLRIS